MGFEYEMQLNASATLSGTIEPKEELTLADHGVVPKINYSVKNIKISFFLLGKELDITPPLSEKQKEYYSKKLLEKYFGTNIY